MHVSDVMTAPVVTVGVEGSLHEAVGKMLEHRVGSVVVVDGGPVGIVTRTDVLTAAYRNRDSFESLGVETAMSGDLVTTTPGTSVSLALNAMEANGVKRLPVVSGIDLVGIVTMTDVARHLPDQVREVRRGRSQRHEWGG